MDYRLIWSPIARQDMRDLLAYISEDNPRAGRHFVRSIFQLVQQLPEFPASGRKIP